MKRCGAALREFDVLTEINILTATTSYGRLPVIRGRRSE
jgi:hypothetical protein